MSQLKRGGLSNTLGHFVVIILIHRINTSHNRHGGSPCNQNFRPNINYSCSDSQCQCVRKWACCNYRNLTYIPELPENITSIDFSHNNLNSVSAETFSNITELKVNTLMLRHNKVKDISKNAFTNLPYIQRLDLEGNKEINQTQLSESFYRIQKELELEVILEKCGLTTISHDFFKGLLDSKVVNISLRGNQMKIFNETLFRNLTTLKTLDLSGNWIETITGLASGERLGHDTIENLTLSDNDFVKFPPWFCENVTSTSLYPNLKTLDLSDNFIIFPIRDAWSCLKNLTHLSLAKNVLQVIQDDVFSDLISLEKLDVSHMVRSIKQIGPTAFNISSLKTLHFEHNNMNFKLKSDIQFETLFKYMPNLKSIHLEANKFKFGNSSVVRMLQPLTRLEHLHLDDTDLRGIPDNFLNKFRNLSILNLSKNKISWIEPRAFDDVTKLKELYLYENRIEEINRTSFPDSVKDSLNKINLADNPFSCTPCQNMWFRNWIDNSRIKFLGWPNNYTCYNPTCMREKSLQYYNPKPEDCKEKNPMIAVYISIGVFILILITFSTAGYRGRWYLRYWMIRLPRRCKRLDENESERQGLLQGDNIYDAYVIYNDTDRGFIRETLLPFMEEQHGYRLFIRDRDSEQGAKVDIMVESIYRSNFVIAVVSRKFLKDQWCEFQLSVTIDRQVDLKRKYLLLVTLEDVDKSLLSKSWCVLLTKTPTAEWCDKKNDIKRKLFDHQIATTIPHTNSNHTVIGQINADLLASE